MKVLLEIIAQDERLQLVQAEVSQTVKIVTGLEKRVTNPFQSAVYHSDVKKVIPEVHVEKIITTNYQILSQTVSDFRSCLRLIARTKSAEEALKELGEILASRSVKEYIPMLNSYDIVRHKSTRVPKTFSFSNNLPRTEFRGIGFSLIQQNRAWTIRRGKLVRINTYKLKDQFQACFKQTSNFSNAIQSVLDLHTEDLDITK